MKHAKRRQRQERERREGQTAEAAEAAGAREATKATEGPTSGNALKPWWDQAGRFEYELAQLDAAGITYKIDEEARASGLLVLELKTKTAEGEELRLVARFPDVYPYTRFEIQAPDLDLPRHQVPFTKQLCLIGRATLNWDTDSTLADFIQERVPLVLKTARSNNPEEIATLEEHQGEPFSDYYAYKKNAMVMIDSSFVIEPSIDQGLLVLGVEEGSKEGLRGAILKVTDLESNMLAEADPAFANRYHHQIKGRWLRSPQPIRANGEAFLTECYSLQPSFERPKWELAAGARWDVMGVIFPEEQKWRGYSDGWVFAIRQMPFGGTGGGHYFYLARIGRAGREDLLERVPELRFMKTRTVSVVGVGGIGAPSALELARCGVGTLRLLDGDFVDPAGTIRWPLGLSVAGLDKVKSLANFISANYPYTKVQTYSHRLGIPRDADIPSDFQALEELVTGADIIYDASAEFGVNHLISDMCAQLGLPYVSVSTTFGAWGGRIVKILPDPATACWICLQHWLLEEKIPVLTEDPAGAVQPAGCADPTFTGAGFDVASVALAGVRTTVSTLAAGEIGSYPSTEWDVAVLTFREDTGQLRTPKWETFRLDRHPNCNNNVAHPSHGLD